MSLQDVPYREDYRSGHDNIVEDFFRPSLREAREYWRAVGYFSSSAFEAFGAPLGEFVESEGRIRLITSVELSEADLKSIEAGMTRREICAERLVRIIDEEFAEGASDGASRLVRLLELGRLEIRIAVPKTGTGIYHEKIGIFLNGSDYVAFTGSSNESRNAFENNRECIDVYTSWGSVSRAERKRMHFEALWNQEDAGVDVYSFPDAAKKQLLRIRTKHDEERSSQQEMPAKWRHQAEAVKTFLAAERGVLDMATGTGKTRVAIEILRMLFERNEIDSAIVSTDGNDLLDQWFGQLQDAARNLRERPVISRHYGGMKQLDNFALEIGSRILLASRDSCAQALRRLSSEKASRTLLVHDEVHGLGSPGNRKRLAGLSKDIRFRLGLSATPERAYDQEGNTFIEDHIGPVIMTFGLNQAIEREILSPFDYFPLPYKLTDGDRERIADVYRRRSAKEAAGEPMTDEEFWIAIAQVYKTSEAKLPVFKTFIEKHQNFLERCIVFAGDRSYGRSVMDIVQKFRPDIHTYFSGEDANTLRRFARGDLECLIACHRLSEGIDIRSLGTVILFSSDKARLETIQRLGRCLRIDPGNPEKIANIVDFIRESGEDDDPNADELRGDWLSRLSRKQSLE